MSGFPMSSVPAIVAQRAKAKFIEKHGQEAYDAGVKSSVTKKIKELRAKSEGLYTDLLVQEGLVSEQHQIIRDLKRELRPDKAKIAKQTEWLKTVTAKKKELERESRKLSTEAARLHEKLYKKYGESVRTV